MPYTYLISMETGVNISITPNLTFWIIVREIYCVYPYQTLSHTHTHKHLQLDNKPNIYIYKWMEHIRHIHDIKFNSNYFETNDQFYFYSLFRCDQHLVSIVWAFCVNAYMQICQKSTNSKDNFGGEGWLLWRWKLAKLNYAEAWWNGLRLWVASMHNRSPIWAMALQWPGCFINFHRIFSQVGVWKRTDWPTHRYNLRFIVCTYRELAA